MILEWWNNVRMSLKWVILAQRDTITLDPPPLCQQCAKRFMIFARMGGSRPTITLVSDQIWPLAAHPQRLHPYFHTHIWMTIYLSEWALNDGMTFKWWNDIQMMEWHSKDGMTFKWWNDIQMTKWHSNDGMILKWWNKERMGLNELFWHKGILLP